MQIVLKVIILTLWRLTMGIPFIKWHVELYDGQGEQTTSIVFHDLYHTGGC